MNNLGQYFVFSRYHGYNKKAKVARSKLTAGLHGYDNHTADLVGLKLSAGTTA